MDFEFAETEVEPRAIRRLAASRGSHVGYNASRGDAQWTCYGVQMDDDEVWAVLSSCGVATTSCG